MNDGRVTKQDLDQVMDRVKNKIEGKITVAHPIFKNNFQKPVPFCFFKDQNKDQSFLFIFEPHNERTLTNAIEPTLELLINFLVENQMIDLSSADFKNLKLNRKLRIFQEDSEGYVDEVLCSVDFKKTPTMMVDHKKNGVKTREDWGNKTKSKVENLSWEFLSKNFAKKLENINLITNSTNNNNN